MGARRSGQVSEVAILRRRTWQRTTLTRPLEAEGTKVGGDAFVACASLGALQSQRTIVVEQRTCAMRTSSSKPSSIFSAQRRRRSRSSSVEAMELAEDEGAERM